MYFCFLFFFKQKTAYEMRISDWSSDVCSSDLSGARLKILICMQFVSNAISLPRRAEVSAGHRVPHPVDRMAAGCQSPAFQARFPIGPRSLHHPQAVQAPGKLVEVLPGADADGAAGR